MPGNSVPRHAVGSFALGVDPDSRTKGIGTRLFEAICERFQQEGIQKIRTMLARNDHLNMSFFRSQGMRGGPFIQLEKNLPK
ncbi:MAG: GNAT family N-acetyltransferase [SAR324 cluster bacterium]|nr:GNAT family N-acetyltransferase [SAR324 cluster bacterium]